MSARMPECFDSRDQWEQWLMAARVSGLLDRCHDARAAAILAELKKAEGAEALQLERYYSKAVLQAVRSDPREPPYCIDCTREYQKRMCREERCAHPEVKFRIAYSDEEKTFELVGDRA